MGNKKKSIPIPKQTAISNKIAANREIIAGKPNELRTQNSSNSELGTEKQQQGFVHGGVVNKNVQETRPMINNLAENEKVVEAFVTGNQISPQALIPSSGESIEGIEVKESDQGRNVNTLSQKTATMVEVSPLNVKYGVAGISVSLQALIPTICESIEGTECLVTDQGVETKTMRPKLAPMAEGLSMNEKDEAAVKTLNSGELRSSNLLSDLGNGGMGFDQGTQGKLNVQFAAPNNIGFDQNVLLKVGQNADFSRSSDEVETTESSTEMVEVYKGYDQGSVGNVDVQLLDPDIDI